MTIDVEGTPRTVLSIAERTNGDLVINTRPAMASQPVGSFQTSDVKKIQQQRYSIHTSLDSATKINVIKHTLVNEAGAHETRHYTKAIKQTNSFAPLYFRKYPDLTPDRYAAPADRTNAISLGSYDPKNFTLLLGVFVGAPDREFITVSGEDFIVTQHRFEFFRLVLLCSFVHLVSHTTGNLTHIMTVPPETAEGDSKKWTEFIAGGLHETDSVDLYRKMRDHLRDVFLQALAKHHSGDPVRRRQVEIATNTAKIFGYFRTGRIDTPEWWNWMAFLQGFGLSRPHK